MVIVNSEQGERLGLTHKGIGVVEHYLMARRLMTRNIYFHQKKLAFEGFLVKLLSHLSESLEDYASFNVIKKTPLGYFLLCANEFNCELKTTKNIEMHKQKFIEKHYVQYKELCDYDIFAIIKLLAQLDGSHAAIQIAKRLQSRIMPNVLRLNPSRITDIESTLLQFKQLHGNMIEDWQIVLIRTPHQSYTAEEDPILIKCENNNVKTLSDISFIVQAIGDKLEHTVFLSVDNAVYKNPVVQELLKELMLD
jgi:HD superfamily phosphohydrolase